MPVEIRRTLKRTRCARNNARKGRGLFRKLFLETLEDRILPSAVLSTDNTIYQPGETALVSGSGFSPDENVTLQVQYSNGATGGPGQAPWTVTADDSGAFNTTWFVGSDTVGLRFVLSASGDQGDSATASFSEAPAVVTDQGDYVPGDTAIITGSGFYPNENVTLQVQYSSGGAQGSGDVPWTVTTDDSGVLSTSWAVPPDAAGQSLLLTAAGADGDSASYGFIDSVTDTWTGTAGDGQWTTASNWSNGMPGSTSDVVIGSGNTVSLATSATINSLDLAGTLNVSGSGNTLTMSTAPASGNALESSGVLTVGSGATVTFAAGTSTLSAGSSVSGAGAVKFSGGTVNVAGTYNITGTTAVNGGTANFTAPITSLGTSLSISSGTANFSTGAAVSVATLTMSGGTLTGSDGLTVTGAGSSWTGGTIAGTGSISISAGASFNLNVSSASYNLNRAMFNQGTVTWSGNNALSGTGTFTNQTGAVFNAQSGFTFAPSFVNQAGAVLDASAGSFNGSFTNNGTVNVTGGLTLGSASGTGLFDVSSGKTLTLAGSASFGVGSSFTDAGNIDIHP